MFICTDCLENNYSNRPTLFRSMGKCEICNKNSDCSEIKSSDLKMLEKYQPDFVMVEFMYNLGYELRSDKAGYLEYRSTNKALKRNFLDAYDLPQDLSCGRGMILVYFNTVYAVKHKVVFCSILMDAGTRTVYAGVIHDEMFLRQLLVQIQ